MKHAAVVAGVSQSSQERYLCLGDPDNLQCAVWRTSAARIARDLRDDAPSAGFEGLLAYLACNAPQGVPPVRLGRPIVPHI